MQNYRQLSVWRKAHAVALNVHRVTGADFAKFVQVAIGSASELEYHLHFAVDAGLLSNDEFAARHPEVVEVRRMLIGLLKKLRTSSP